MELIDILDDQGNPTGKQAEYQEAHEKGLWHSTAHIWIYDGAEGKILLQKRGYSVQNFPGKWDISAAGHVDAGETPEEAAVREVEEEIELRVDPHDLQRIEIRKRSTPATKKGWTDNEFSHVFLLRVDNVLEKTELGDEVKAVMLLSPEEFEQALADPKEKDDFVPHGQYYHDVIAAVREELKKIK